MLLMAIHAPQKHLLAIELELAAVELRAPNANARATLVNDLVIDFHRADQVVKRG
jgi:hypothetical protein